MKKTIALTLSILLLSAAHAGTVSAQLLMSRSRVEKTVSPGTTVADTIRLYNRSNEAMPLTIYWEDFDYIEPFNGDKKFLSGNTSEYSMASWISFSPREATIPPGSSIEVNYTIRIPASAKGGHYGVMFFESGKRRRAEGTGVNIITRVGSLFFIELTDKVKSSVIKDMKFSAQDLKGVFENKGNVILFPRGIYYIMDQEGLVFERGEVDKIYLPPNKEAAFSIPLSESLQPGRYSLVLTFDLGDGESVVKEVDYLKKDDSHYELLEVRD